jgi:SAM-dependent methyltransferase
MSAYEPPVVEALVTALLARTVLVPYYARRVHGLGLRGDERVLDYGSGPGVAARYIAARLAAGGGRLTCVDVSRTWMRVAQRTTRRYSNLDYRHGDIATLAVEDGAYDVVFIHFVLHDIPARERPGSVCHLAAKLRTGGRLVIREPTSRGHGISPQEISRLLSGAGLERVSLDTSKLLAIQPICDGVFCKGT